MCGFDSRPRHQQTGHKFRPLSDFRGLWFWGGCPRIVRELFCGHVSRYKLTKLTTFSCLAVRQSPTVQRITHPYRFGPGDRVKIVSGKYAGATGTVDSKVFQNSADYPEELVASYHVVLDAGKVVTVRVGQVSPV